MGLQVPQLGKARGHGEKHRENFARRAGCGAETHERERARHRNARADAAADHQYHNAHDARQQRERDSKALGAVAAARVYERDDEPQRDRRGEKEKKLTGGERAGRESA